MSLRPASRASTLLPATFTCTHPRRCQPWLNSPHLLRRLVPVLVMRTLMCALPFVSDTVGLFPPTGFTPLRQVGRALFMLVRPSEPYYIALDPISL